MGYVGSFDEILDDFLQRASKVVWCNVATVDASGRPRSRILHPLWEGTIGWITTDPRTLKARHLAVNPHLSLAYVADIASPMYVDCTAEWVDDVALKQHVWDLCLSTPPPLGFDPEPIYATVDGPRFGVLRLTPWRVQLMDGPGVSRIWKP